MMLAPIFKLHIASLVSVALRLLLLDLLRVRHGCSKAPPTEAIESPRLGLTLFDAAC
jgi:hypothetical protein